MQNQTSNKCFRCNKERVVVKTWKEKVNNSTVVHTETACPDKECQEVVDSQNTALRDKRITQEENKAKAELQRALAQKNRKAEKALRA
jgi:hypothetical protein